ncbi:MAG: dimethylarginine dimethylaminohydrolase family protein, partial [Anaerolineae bacterium]
MCQQHQAYIAALQSLDVTVQALPELPDFPDAYFVEDVAVVTPEVAVLTRPGAAARAGEVAHIEAALAAHRPLARIEAPGTLDGGDVMQVARDFFVGISERTNEAGAAQLGQILAKFGYTVTAVPLAAGLHLKSSVNALGQNTLLLTPSFAEMAVWDKYDLIVVDEAEAYAANTLWVNGRLLTPAGFPQTKAKLLAAGFDVMELDVSEAQKMDGGLSCMSLRF